MTMTPADVAALIDGTTPGQIPEVWDAGIICNEMYWGRYRGPMLLVDSDLLTAANHRATAAEADAAALSWGLQTPERLTMQTPEKVLRYSDLCDRVAARRGRR